MPVFSNPSSALCDTHCWLLSKDKLGLQRLFKLLGFEFSLVSNLGLDNELVSLL